MKKIVSILLATFMIAALGCAAVSADVLFYDPFNEWTSYWSGYDDPNFGGDAHRIVNYNGENVLEGWEEARVHQANYEGDEEFGVGYAATLSALTTGTIWVDVMAESNGNDNGGAGLWWKNTYYAKHEGAEDADLYTLKYYPGTSTVKFIREFPAAQTDDEKILIEWEDPRALGDNMNTPITLGLRIEPGKISAFVDGNWIYTHEDSSIGVDACPPLFWNDGIHVLWDNYYVGDLNELPLPSAGENNSGGGDVTTAAGQENNGADGTTAAGNNSVNNGENNANNGDAANNGSNGASGVNGANGANGADTRVESVVETKVETSVVVVGTDAEGNAITEVVSEIVSEIVTRPVANTNSANPNAGNGGSQTGDMTWIVISAMVVSLGAAILVKKFSVK